MSIESVNEFRDKVKNSPELETVLRELFFSDGRLDLPGAVKLGEQHGFSFSEDEIVALFANDNDELSDFELEMVSAGAPINCNSGTSDIQT